jgi:hypothetical protein
MVALASAVLIAAGTVAHADEGAAGEGATAGADTVEFTDAPLVRAQERTPPRTFRGLAIFGTAVGIQTAGVLTAVIAGAASDGLSDRSVQVSYGVVLAITPTFAALAGASLAAGCTTYRSSTLAMFVGGYLGAAMAYLGAFFYVERDDPKVDGKYDPIYFEEDHSGERALGALTLALLPIFLPAIGVAVGYRVTREPRGDDRAAGGRPAAALAPPSPTFYRSDPRGPVVPGLRLLSLAF